MVVGVTSADGTTDTALGVPVKLGESPGAVLTPPAAFGEHTREILSVYGYSAREIDDLEAQDII